VGTWKISYKLITCRFRFGNIEVLSDLNAFQDVTRWRLSTLMEPADHAVQSPDRVDSVRTQYSLSSRNPNRLCPAEA
jgi:hypothetical protein